MPQQRSLQFLELMEENAAAQVAQLEAILRRVEDDHPAHPLVVQAVEGARERQRALEAAWKAALEVLARSQH